MGGWAVGMGATTSMAVLRMINPGARYQMGWRPAAFGEGACPAGRAAGAPPASLPLPRHCYSAPLAHLEVAGHILSRQALHIHHLRQRQGTHKMLS